ARAVRLRRVVGHGAGADVARTGVAVVRGEVAAVGDDVGVAVAVAHVLLAVARRLRGDGRVRRRVGDAADAPGAGAGLALGVGAGAVGGGRAAGAEARVVADEVRPAGGALREDRVGVHAVRADVLRAGVAVDGQIRVVVDHGAVAGAVAHALLAV